TADEHILALTAHHIISDMESLGLLYQELELLYDAYRPRVISPLDEPVPQFPDFADHQRRAATSEIDLSFWREHWQGEVAPLEFPTDAPRHRSAGNGASFHFEIPPDLTASLAALSHKSGVGRYTTLLAAFQVFAYRYSGLSDFTVGTPFSQRDFPEAEKMIGYLVNLLVLRLRTSDAESFQDLLEQLHGLTRRAYAHLNAPFPQLVETLRLPRQEGAHPLCRVVFQYLPNGIAELRLPGLRVEPIHVHTHTAKFDWTLTLAEQNGGLFGEIEFDSDLFEQTTVVRMAQNFEILLRGIVGNPNEQVVRLPWQSAQDRQRLTTDWNGAKARYPENATIHQLFEEQAEATPEQTAIVFEDEKLTYRALNERANQLASHLRKLGVRPGEPTGLCLERSIDLMVGLIGILKAGGAYVPFDANYPGERLRYLLHDSRVRVIITNRQLANRLSEAFVVPPLGGRGLEPPEGGTPDESFQTRSEVAPAVLRVVIMEDKQPIIAAEPHVNLPDQGDSERMAYIIYTSGSTGNPKGVAVPHRGVVRLVKNADYARFNTDEVFLQFAPVSFDASTFEIWGPLLNGATLAIYPPTFDSLEQLGQVLERHKVTTLWLTAGLFNYLVDAGAGALGGVRQLLVGGDVVSVPHIRKALRAWPGTQLINGYGPTENTTFTCCYSIPRDWPEHRSIPIGVPINNTQVYILDRLLQPVPIGVPGELYAGGDGVALGYWNQPELTAERFVDDPFSSQQGRKLYRTGDMARWRADGTIEFVGRLDHQVKVRGFRIELGEVERTFAELDTVQDAVVTTQSDGHGTKYLLAYVVPKPGNQITESSLRHQIATRLPAHAVPSRIVFLDRLPLSANGKVDRNALPTPDRVVPSARRELVQPSDEIETRLLEIWRDLLRAPALDVTDNFFEAGGHSLLATRLVMQINKAFDTCLSIATIFQAPSVRMLAE
ncbi:MAG: amino acid adenylation domain-containing protein, partial [Verrucomicrobiales bacterium]|nr:amino acid adenylation domain-containing protein [Verrucomicrobiales bacterium]